MVFYAQSTSTVISGRMELAGDRQTDRKREKETEKQRQWKERERDWRETDRNR